MPHKEWEKAFLIFTLTILPVGLSSLFVMKFTILLVSVLPVHSFFSFFKKPLLLNPSASVFALFLQAPHSFFWYNTPED